MGPLQTSLESLFGKAQRNNETNAERRILLFFFRIVIPENGSSSFP